MELIRPDSRQRWRMLAALTCVGVAGGCSQGSTQPAGDHPSLPGDAAGSAGDPNGQPLGDSSHPPSGDAGDAFSGDGATGGDAPATHPRILFEPPTVTAGSSVVVHVEDTSPWAYVNLAGSGPCGAVTFTTFDVDQVLPGVWRWSYTTEPLTGGTYSFGFTRDSGGVLVIDALLEVSGATDCDPDPIGPPPNPFGIGLVSEGSTAQLDLVANLTGDGGHLLMIFAGVEASTMDAAQSWKDRLQEAYDRNLVPVVRVGPGWGQMNVRDDAEPGSNHLDYSGLAQAYRRVIESLPLRSDWPLYVQVHNEPNLCYEWTCSAGAGTWLSAETMAAEYAAFLRDVADALHAIGDSRIKVSLGALAPGGVTSCECCNECGWSGGDTGLDYMNKMAAAVPEIWDRLDFLASHSYPAEGVGWGFFVPYDRAATGLTYYESELALIGRDLPVMITETGWSTRRPDPACPGSNPCPSEAEMASYTQSAFEGVWLVRPEIRGVMPFILQDGFWGDDQGFGWVHTNGTRFSVYDTVRALRCAQGHGPGC